ncbi:hypothetical protein BDY21DRAFT_343049 [Lineolata rhizophorae]|uniref:Uncharacterized protein n=1 Tax=Lineolata rhizophorae TaxID=578093 RepID=A0A6A6P335_9PEZI|nr:hypothetical protein BDY21DRAFT_343049 [Lineolata rhizophorae]
MAGETNVSVKDVIPIPETTSPVTDPDKREVAHSLGEQPTASHALAMAEAGADGEDKGVVQETGKRLSHEENKRKDEVEDVADLGWNKPGDEIPKPLVGRLPNEELWVLVRRFNKQTYHLKEIEQPPQGGLDLNIADEEEFSPDKLRSNLERFYMTLVIGLMAFGKQIVRLRSWRETRRTAAFCAAYFIAWLFDFLTPLFSLSLIALIVYPPSRSFLFPPAPIALVNSSTGGVQKPQAGVLGSHDSATGAPENHKGEAVEQEASNFVNGIASIALSSAAGKHPQGEPPEEEENTPHDSVPDPTAVAVGAANAKDKASGGSPTEKVDKTKVPMETAMWTKMRPAMHGLSDLTDTWERVANALSPTPPFPRNAYRLRLAMLIVPLFLISLVTTSYMFMKGVTFGMGFGFFGDPIIQRGFQWLNTTFPNWQKLLELRNTVLKGVPTNAQLTITLLRIGEANKAPLPPPPRASTPPPNQPAELTSEQLSSTGADKPLAASDSDLDEAAGSVDESKAHETGGQDIDDSRKPKHGKGAGKILDFFKGTTKASIQTAIGLDKVRASAGSDAAKNRLGVVPAPSVPAAENQSGPVDFRARYKGRRGRVYITVRATIPCVAFTTAEAKVERIGGEKREDLHPVWSVAVADIAELRKIGGYGWKAKLVVGWALDRDVKDGLEIVTRKGERFVVTAMPLRDELFNRLVAMGGQKWESW